MPNVRLKIIRHFVFVAVDMMEIPKIKSTAVSQCQHRATQAQIAQLIRIVMASFVSQHVFQTPNVVHQKHASVVNALILAI